jgi:hypothetical protein
MLFSLCAAVRAVCQCGLLILLSPLLLIADVVENTPADGATETELFAAIDAGDVDVTLIPRDSRRVTIQVENKTDQPLAIRLPKAFAGVPVLAQFGGPGGGLGGLLGGGGGGGGGAGGAPQALGMGFPGGGNPGGGLFGGPGGVMNVPPGKVLKIKRASVCLEYGKPEPGPRVPYKIAPLATVSDDPALAELLTVLAHDELDQRVAQIIAWHFANGMSWEEIAGLTIKHITGRRTPRFTAEEIRAAQILTAALPSQQKETNQEPGDTLSRK